MRHALPAQQLLIGGHTAIRTSPTALPPSPQLNPFSLAFEKAAELAGILPESVLDASVVLIAADEVDLFLESLDDAFASVEQGRM
jgi:hypothetical protein